MSANNPNSAAISALEDQVNDITSWVERMQERHDSARQEASTLGREIAQADHDLQSIRRTIQILRGEA